MFVLILENKNLLYIQIIGIFYFEFIENIAIIYTNFRDNHKKYWMLNTSC